MERSDFNKYSICNLQYSIPQRLLRIYLGRQRITVLLKDIIHAAFGKLGLFIIAAANLLFLIVGRADRHLLPFTEVDHQMRHHSSLPLCKIYSLSPKSQGPF